MTRQKLCSLDKWIISISAAVLSLSVGEAQTMDHDWYRLNACVTEHAMYTNPSQRVSGQWSNAPRTFWIRAVEKEDKIRPGTIGAVLEYKGLAAFDGWMDSKSRPLRPSWGSWPGWTSQLFVLNADGTMDFTEQGNLENAPRTWFMLRANCTVYEEP